MTRRYYAERILRQIYNGFPAADSNITFSLVLAWLPDAIGAAARKNYTDSLQLDGIAYVNNSFYTTYSSLAITKDSNFTYKITLPEIPVGLGRNEGISTLQLVDSSNNVSFTGVPLSMNQVTYIGNMRPIKNKLIYYPEGKYCYILSTLILTPYTAKIKMISGGDNTDLDSELNLPPDYFPVIVEYMKQQLLVEKSIPQDVTNDGVDNS